MARAELIFLNEREEDLIHEQSMETLEKIGVRVDSRSVLELLEERGARVDYDTMVAKLPEAMVEKALETAPEEFALCARNPEWDLPLPAHPYPYAATSGLAINVPDWRTGEYRASTREDVGEFAKLGDALEAVDFVWTALTAGDVPKGAHGPHELWVTMQNSSKHVTSLTVQSAEDANVQIELAALVAGGRDALRKRPLISVISCPIAPLAFEEGAIEAQVEFAKAGVPICSMSMSMGGVSAPVTVAGMVTNANTENLASLTITQAACPGSPQIYTSESAPMNLQTGTINYFAPEKTLISIALAQLAKRYHLPCMVSDNSFGSEIQPNVGPFSDLAIQFLGDACNTDILNGMGSVDCARGCSFEQLVIDAYIWDCIRDFRKEVEVTKERIGLDAVAEVGQGHHFLASKHTKRYMREETTQWDAGRLKMLSADAATLASESRKIVEQLLNEHRVQSIDEDLIRQGDEIIRAYEERLAG
jgi:trimethylamine--corrinoid protein Co-methyltransferase